jgi:amino acid adenylation domain-containing protein
MTTLYEWFAASAARHPDEPALDLAGEVLTYGELRDRAEAVASTLLAAHGSAPARVALLAGRGLVSFAGYLAALRLGAAVVPLNPTHPVRRNELIRDALPCDVLLVDDGETRELGGLANGSGTVVRLTDDAVRAAPVSPPPALAATAADIAYVLFTSGSTGRPKGVPITHANLAPYVSHNIERFAIGPGCRVSHTFDLTFDPSVFDLFVTWGGGATLVAPSRTDLLNPVDFLVDRAITHWFSVPSVVSVSANLGNLPAGRATGLRQSIFIGEQLTYAQVAAWRTVAPNSRIDNVYGPTELTVACTEYRLPASPDEWPTTSNDTVPIGPVYGHLDHVIVDEDGRLAEEGELCVRGSQRYGGYVDPADNRGRFMILAGDRYVPSDEVTPESYYRTGDRVRTEDGHLVHLSRLDNQLKIWGYRVELGEVEATIARHPSVTQSVVLAEHGPDGPELVAFYTGTSVPARQLVAWLREHLPIHMVPRQLHHRPTLPLNVNGKIDRQALRATT